MHFLKMGRLGFPARCFHHFCPLEGSAAGTAEDAAGPTGKSAALDFGNQNLEGFHKLAVSIHRTLGHPRAWGLNKASCEPSPLLQTH